METLEPFWISHCMPLRKKWQRKAYVVTRLFLAQSCGKYFLSLSDVLVIFVIINNQFQIQS